MTAMRYLMVIEGDGETNYSADSPDVSGVAATGATRNGVGPREMRNAIEFHLKGLREDDEGLPGPHSTATYAVVDVG
jgi:predicted RNase H-like HicB family nuclease